MEIELHQLISTDFSQISQPNPRPNSKDSTAVPATKVQWTTLAIIPLSPLGLLKQCNGGQVGDRLNLFR